MIVPGIAVLLLIFKILAILSVPQGETAVTEMFPPANPEEAATVMELVPKPDMIDSPEGSVQLYELIPEVGLTDRIAPD